MQVNKAQHAQKGLNPLRTKDEKGRANHYVPDFHFLLCSMPGSDHCFLGLPKSSVF